MENNGFIKKNKTISLDILETFIPEENVSPAQVTVTDDREVRVIVGHQVCLDGVKVLIKKSIKLSIMRV